MADAIWTIDVCATCGQLASWPFCVHGQAAHASFNAKRWTIPVVVKPARPGEYQRHREQALSSSLREARA